MDNTAQPNTTTPTTPETAAPASAQRTTSEIPMTPPTTPETPSTPPVTPGTPTTAPAMGATPPAEKKPLSKFVIVLVVLIFLVLLGVGGYLMMSKPTTPTPVAAVPTAAPTVTMSPEETEVNAIDTGASDSSDLDEVQNDVNSLTTPSPSTTK